MLGRGLAVVWKVNAGSSLQNRFKRYGFGFGISSRGQEVPKGDNAAQSVIQHGRRIVMADCVEIPDTVNFIFFRSSARGLLVVFLATLPWQM